MTYEDQMLHFKCGLEIGLCAAATIAESRGALGVVADINDLRHRHKLHEVFSGPIMTEQRLREILGVTP